MRMTDSYNAEVVYSYGNIHQMMYPRSAVKYTQILPLLESGAADHFGFTDEEIAVMCASHNGQPEHLAVVRSILSKIGAAESDLSCGGHWPETEFAVQYIKDGIDLGGFKEHIFNNCSGKHAGFLALAKYIGAPLTGYLERTHPVQELVRLAVSDVFGIPLDRLHAGVDGCSAPAYAMTVVEAAVGFGKITAFDLNPNETRRAAMRRVVRAVTTFPLMVRGTNSFCTDFLTAGGGDLLGKVGAAGVYVSGILSKRIACAVKIDDGSMGPQYNVTMRFIRWAGVDLSEAIKRDSALGRRLEKYTETPQKACVDTVVGTLFASDDLFPEQFMPTI